jgi:hypothetical protein
MNSSEVPSQHKPEFIFVIIVFSLSIENPVFRENPHTGMKDRVNRIVTLNQLLQPHNGFVVILAEIHCFIESISSLTS